MIEILKVALFVIMFMGIMVFAALPFIYFLIKDEEYSGWALWLLFLTIPFAISIGNWIVDNYILLDWFLK